VTDSPATPCPNCGARSTGKFCTACGTRLAPLTCAACGDSLAPGSRFCVHCGAPAGGATGNPVSASRTSVPNASRLSPWQIVGLLGVVAAVAAIWALTGPGRKPAVTPVPASGTTPAAVAPDISNMSPREQFGRLADKVETAMESGDTATVVRFYPMAEQAWTNLATVDRDLDARFHLSLLRARIGHAPAALAQADTIAASAPRHLFADYLRAIIGDFQADSTAARRARQNFREHFAAEIALNRPEYQAHRQMLDQFLATIPAKPSSK
jgi:hypothetical protein